MVGCLGGWLGAWLGRWVGGRFVVVGSLVDLFVGTCFTNNRPLAFNIRVCLIFVCQVVWPLALVHNGGDNHWWEVMMKEAFDYS